MTVWVWVKAGETGRCPFCKTAIADFAAQSSDVTGPSRNVSSVKRKGLRNVNPLYVSFIVTVPVFFQSLYGYITQGQLHFHLSFLFFSAVILSFNIVAIVMMRRFERTGH